MDEVFKSSFSANLEDLVCREDMMGTYTMYSLFSLSTRCKLLLMIDLKFYGLFIIVGDGSAMYLNHLGKDNKEPIHRQQGLTGLVGRKGIFCEDNNLGVKSLQFQDLGLALGFGKH